jgi:hypothetical protein
MKRRPDRIHWQIEQNDGRVMKSLEDPQFEDVGKVAVRQKVRHEEGTHEIVGLVFEVFAPLHDPECRTKMEMN